MVSSLELVAIIATVAASLTASYAAYWALEIRRALAVRLYRNQALGIGLLAVSMAIIQPYYAGDSLVGWPAEFAFAIILLFCLVLFYWTNASVIAARRLDPLLRDTLRWSRLRLVLLVPIVAAAVYDFANIAHDIATGYAVPSTATGFFVITFMIPIDIPVITAAVVLPIVSRRSRDPVFREQLIWFGFFAASVLAFVVILASLFSNTSEILLVQGLGEVVAGYCLYRSVRSLVPLNRIT